MLFGVRWPFVPQFQIHPEPLMGLFLLGRSADGRPLAWQTPACFNQLWLGKLKGFFQKSSWALSQKQTHTALPSGKTVTARACARLWSERPNAHAFSGAVRGSYTLIKQKENIGRAHGLCIACVFLREWKRKNGVDREDTVSLHITLMTPCVCSMRK